MMKRITTLLLALGLTILSTVPVHTRAAVSANQGTSSSSYNVTANALGNGPEITAESAILMDARTGAVLYGKEEETKRYPASITKVMTALLAIENCKMNDIVTYSNAAVNGIEAGSSTAGINVGAQLTVEDSLYALMLVSANEAGAALAEHVSGSSEEFAKLMTARAKELGCTNTNFKNPHGLPDEEHYTTAHDMALILQEAMKHDEFRTIAGADTYTLKKSDTLNNTLELWNHAKILRENSDYYYEPVEGAKTGFTQAALNTLVTYAKKDNVELICVILKDYGADSSYYDTTALYKWGFEKVKALTPLSNFQLNAVISQDESLKTKEKKELQSLTLSFDSSYYLLVPKDFDESKLSATFVLDQDTAEKRIGYIVLSGPDKEEIGRTPVTYKENLTTQADGSEDNLETAPLDKSALTPHKLFGYFLRFVVAIVLICIIMKIIAKRVNKAQKRKEIASRYMKNGKSGSRKGKHEK